MNTKSMAMVLTGLATLFYGAASLAEGPMRVTVGLPPVAGLVERIGGNHVSVQVLAPSGQCQHDLALSPKQVAELGKTRLLFTAGVPFEERLREKVGTLYPTIVAVDASQGIAKRRLGEPCGHEHGAEEHAACVETLDPHVWLSPAALKIMSENIAAALKKADPPNEAVYRANASALAADIDKVAAHLEEALGPLRGKTLWAYHPTFGYLADAYGLKQKAIEAGGSAPSAKALRELIRQARADGVKVIFVEPLSDQRGAQLVAEAVGCAVVPLDPLAKDVLKNLDEMAGKIRSGLRAEPKK